MKINKIWLVLLLFSSVCGLKAQPNFQPGYLVFPSGDSIPGFIDYEYWEKSPRQIAFKEEPGSPVKKYNPLDLRRFGVMGDVYISGVLELEVTTLEVHTLVEDPTLRLMADTVFLQTLFEGEKSLYFHRSETGRDNFFIKKNGKPELLIYKKYLKSQGNEKIVGENKTYTGQLSLYLQDCPTLDTKMLELVYTRKSLVDLFRYYYSCASTLPAFERKQKGPAAEMGVIAGGTYTQLNFEVVGNSFIYLREARLSSSRNLTGGVFLNLGLPGFRRKISLQNEILYSAYQAGSTYRDVQSDVQYVDYTTDMALSYLKINTLFRYKWPVNKFSVFVNGGISNGLGFPSVNNVKIESTFYSTTTTVEKEAVEGIRRYEQGLMVGGGVRYGKVQLEARYERGNGMSPFTSLFGRVNRYFLLLGYNF